MRDGRWMSDVSKDCSDVDYDKSFADGAEAEMVGKSHGVLHLERCKRNTSMTRNNLGYLHAT